MVGATLSLKADLTGINGLAARLNGLHLSSGQKHNLLANIGEAVVSQSKERFRDEKGPDNEDWKPSRRAEAEDGQTLTYKAILKNSINYQVSGSLVEIGTNVEYGGIHQFGLETEIVVASHQRIISQAFGRALKFPVAVSVGAHTKKMKMPARPYLGLSPENEGELLQVVDDWVIKVTGRAG